MGGRNEERQYNMSDERKCPLCPLLPAKPATGATGATSAATAQQGCSAYLTTTRFNNITWRECRAFVEAGRAGDGVGCCYSSPIGVSQRVPRDALVFVLEMHNDVNQIMGVGAIYPRSAQYRQFQVYSDDKYNVCSYTGRYRLDRSELRDELVAALDRLCFRGKRHLKRLRGITLFPIDIIQHCKMAHDMDIGKEIRDAFLRKFPRKKSSQT
jgi:hypothetical protein